MFQIIFGFLVLKTQYSDINLLLTDLMHLLARHLNVYSTNEIMISVGSSPQICVIMATQALYDNL